MFTDLGDCGLTFCSRCTRDLPNHDLGTKLIKVDGGVGYAQSQVGKAAVLLERSEKLVEPDAEIDGFFVSLRKREATRVSTKR